MKRNNIHITGIPEEEKKKEVESIFKAIMAKNFPNLGRQTDIQIQEAQRFQIGSTPIGLHRDTS